MLVTGGTAGIGRAIAEQCIAEDARTVIITGRDLTGAVRGDDIAAAISPQKAHFIRADHTSADDCQNCVSAIIAQHGRIDVLCNNAGLVVQGSAEDTSDQDWQDTFALNVTAPWRMCKLVIPHMRAAGDGAIVNMGSDWALVGAPAAVAYASSKGALLQMTRCLAVDHARDRIRVNIICPGDTFVERWVEDGYYRGSGSVSRAEALLHRGDIPLGRVADVREIARATVFLMSDDSSYMTGSHLVVDGGNTAR